MPIINEFLEVSSFIGIIIFFKGGFYDAPLSTDLRVELLKEYFLIDDPNGIPLHWDAFLKRPQGMGHLIKQQESLKMVEFVKTNLDLHQFEFYRKALDFANNNH